MVTSNGYCRCLLEQSFANTSIARDHCSILHTAAAVADRLQIQILIMNLSNVKELHEAAKAVFTTTKKIFGAQARYSRVAIVGGMAVTHLTNYHRVTKVSIRASNYVYVERTNSASLTFKVL